MSDGASFDVNIYRKNNNNGITIRSSYGEMEAYISTYTTFAQLDKFVTGAYSKYRGVKILNRPFYKENVYIYLLGKKRYFTDDISLKDSSLYFYVPKGTKDPLTRYKKMFLSYLNAHLPLLAGRMAIDLKGWKIRTGLFLSYYAICFPVQHQLKFDYRLFAYQPEVMDSVLIHELAHTYEIHHNDRFYTIVKMYCPQYDKLNAMIEEGRFEGELDDVYH